MWALTSPTSGGRSVGIVRLRTTATEFNLVLFPLDKIRGFHRVSTLKVKAVDFSRTLVMISECTRYLNPKNTILIRGTC
jgi:hypothetical protein